MNSLKIRAKTPLSEQCPWKILLCLAFITLASCRTIDLEMDFQVDQSLQQRIVTQSTDLYPSIDLLYINDEVKALIDSVVPATSGEEYKVRLLQDILFTEDYLNIQYSDDQTHTAMEVFESREGNCLSVMNLYVAMARYLGLDAEYQTVEVQPHWDRRGDLLVLSQHINARGRFSARQHYVVDFTPEIALQQLTADTVTDHQARALYFNNLGVEALIKEDTEQALIYFQNALFLDDQLSIAWNNIGSTYNWLDQAELAEYSYKMAFNTDDRNATSINNLARFYSTRGDESKAREYRLAIERFNNRNPYYHFAIGNYAYSQENFDEAIDRFRRAIRLKEEEPDFYFALAQTHLTLGNRSAAIRYDELAKQIIVANEEIYQPSDQKVRVIDSSTILRDSSPGISIVNPTN